MLRARIAAPANSIVLPVPPAVPIRPITASTMSLALQPARQRAVDLHEQVLRLPGEQRLRGQHVLDLARADAVRERAEGAVRRGVRVAADDRHARQRRALLGPDHVHDALAPVEEGEVRRRADGADVRVQCRHLLARDRVDDAVVAPLPARGRRVVVGRGDDRTHPPRLAPCQPQPFEGLRARHLVHQVAVDVEHRRAIGLGVDDVVVPQLVVQGAGGHGGGWACEPVIVADSATGPRSARASPDNPRNRGVAASAHRPR